MQKRSGDSGNALFLSAEAPYPAVGGGALRSASLLEYLSQHYCVDTVLFAHSHSPAPAQGLPPGKVGRYVEIELPVHSKTYAARAVRNGRRLARNRPPLLDRFSGHEQEVADFVAGHKYDVALIEHFWCAPYLEALRSSAKKVVLDLHNIESKWHSSLAESSGPLSAFAHRRFSRAYQKLEQEWIPNFDTILVASELDRKRILPLSRQIVVYPNAVPCVGEVPRVEEDVISFSGNLEFEPNRSAIAFFAGRIWPQVRRRFPTLRWRIIGKNPQGVARLVAHDSSIELVGPVDDAVAWLGRSKVAVVPVLAGSGTRIKILEAWAAGTPVVSTSLGAEGLEAENERHLLLADDPAAFESALVRLLDDANLRERVGSAGRQLCQERYTWHAAWSRLQRSRAF
jgi:polysaccharide biosynthesis protein PslH